MDDKKPIKKRRSKRLQNQQDEDKQASTSKKLKFSDQSYDPDSSSDDSICFRMEKKMGLKKQKPKKLVRSQRQIISQTVNDDDSKDLPPKKRENHTSPRKSLPKKRGKAPHPQPELPSKFKGFIEEVEGTEVRLIIQKRLLPADLNEKRSRFSIPFSLVRTEFLRDDEKSVLQRSEGKIKVKMIAIDPSREPIQIVLRKWEKERVGSSYNLNETWMQVVNENGLKEGDLVQLWSFRKPTGRLHFILVRLTED
ncbi:B3 domain-containing protein At2g31720-like [Dillenia turbinata]|uniref:B3 domain-containing protein At2g31720-like n=1 Tax=Dillenia turbinata TaxID=194707 RepID=A0AAN8VKC4_9MAGN